MEIHPWSRRSHFLISLFFVVVGSLMLTVVVFTKPWVKRSQIVREKVIRPVQSIERNEEPAIPKAVETKGRDEKLLETLTAEEQKVIASTSSGPSIVKQQRGRDEKRVIMGGIEEHKKTPAEETDHRDAIFRREIVEGDIKVMEKKATAIPVQKKLATNEIQEKSEKEIPQFPAITPGVVELEKEEITETDIEQKMKGKIAGKNMKVDGGAPSSVKASFPVVKSETAINEKKSVPRPTQLSDRDVSDDTHSLKKYGAPSDLKGKGISVGSPAINGEDRGIRAKLPSPIATEEDVRQFFANYIERYNQKDIDGFLSLFSPKALQNHKEGFNEIRKIYSHFFNRSRKLSYHLEDMKIKVNQNSAEARAHYKLVQKPKRRWKKRVWKGNIRWVLVRENGILKIRYLDYKPEKSP